MNFLITENKESELKCATIVKFQNNIRMQMDDGSIKGELAFRFKDKDVSSRFRTKCLIRDLVTQEEHEEVIIMFFTGFFRDRLGGRIWLPTGLRAKDYERYDRNNPYLLTFLYRDVEPAAGLKPGEGDDEES